LLLGYQEFRAQSTRLIVGHTDSENSQARPVKTPDAMELLSSSVAFDRLAVRGLSGLTGKFPTPALRRFVHLRFSAPGQSAWHEVRSAERLRARRYRARQGHWRWL